METLSVGLNGITEKNYFDIYFNYYYFWFYQDYGEDITITVKKITAPVIGGEITRRFGKDEEKWDDLNKADSDTLKFLKAAYSFIPLAVSAGADLNNAAFIFQQIGREFVIKAGDGDWEFLFLVEEDSKIRGNCVRKGAIWRYIWDPIREFVTEVAKTARVALVGQVRKKLES